MRYCHRSPFPSPVLATDPTQSNRLKSYLIQTFNPSSFFFYQRSRSKIQEISGFKNSKKMYGSLNLIRFSAFHRKFFPPNFFCRIHNSVLKPDIYRFLRSASLLALYAFMCNHLDFGKLFLFPVKFLETWHIQCIQCLQIYCHCLLKHFILSSCYLSFY